MTETSTPRQLAINPAHVQRQFMRHGRPGAAEFLYGEIARRMFERLKLIRLVPQMLLDAGCGEGARSAMLRERYQNAHMISLDHNPRLLEAMRRNQPAGLRRWFSQIRGRAGQEIVCADLADTGLDAESLDLVWSNLALHWHPDPLAVTREWSRIVKPEGVVFFSCFGPATFIELRQAIQTADLRTAGMPFVDMHDLGDMLIENGFADPVMDQETLTLTYQDPAALLRDARALGGNACSERRASLAGRGWMQRLIDALEQQRSQSGQLKLTVEVSYGHAWRRAVRKQGGETRISLQSIGRKGPRL